MKVKVENTENKNEVKLEITVDSKVFDEGIKKVYEKNKKYFNVPGFRKGNVPMNIVERYYGETMFYEDAFNEIMPEQYAEAIKQENLDVVSRPQMDVVQIGKGKDLIVTCVVSTKPDVKLGKYKGITLEQKEYKVTEDSIKHELDQMLERNSRMVSVTDRAAKNGDKVTIDFAGTVDGKAFDGGTAENHELELGSKTFIPGFEDQVVGMKIDEKKDVKVKFPDDYFSKELAGKDAVFAVTLHEIKVKELPKLDDDFAKDVSEFDTLKELKEDIKAKQEKDNELRAKQDLQEAAINKVTEEATVDIPEGMIDLEVEQMVEDMNRRFSGQGFSIDQYLNMVGKTMEDFRKENRPTAEKQVKMSLTLEAIFKDAKLEVTDKELDERIKELAETYSRKEEELRENEELLANIKSGLETEKAINYIVDNAKVTKAAEKKEDKKEEKAAKAEKEEKPAKKDTKKSSK